MADGSTARDDPRLTTGAAAQMLGVSRQHVVDLCEQGALPCESVGRHRRIRCSDVLAFQRFGGTGGLTRDQLRSLWLNRAVVGKVVANPERVIRVAQRNLNRLQQIHARGKVRQTLADWSRLLDGSVEAVAEALTAKTQWSIELRQSSPFAGVLTERERAAVLRAFRQSQMPR